MRTIPEITRELRNTEFINYSGSSTYSMMNDVLVRVSDHLPSPWTMEYNEGVEKMFFIFAECDLKEGVIQNHLEENYSDIEYDYMIMDGSYDFTIEQILNYINAL
jgi:hypothetical protein